MKKIRIISLLLCLCFVPFVGVQAEESLTDLLQKSAAYIQKAVPQPAVSSIGGEWAVLGLARSGAAVPQAYFDDYYTTAAQYVKERGGVLHKVKYTEYARVALAVSAIGKNPEDVAGYNLLMPLADYDATLKQGLNGPVWALMALDCKAYAMPQNQTASRQASREAYVEYILSRQKADGGWSLTEQGDSDVDITAMALCALSKYDRLAAVRVASDAALAYISAVQNDEGGFVSGGQDNAESAAQVLTALCELNIPVTDARFVKNGHTVLDALMRFYCADGSFLHTQTGEGATQMATEQGFYALAAYARRQNNENSLYDMRDAKQQQSEPQGETIGLLQKHADVQKQSVLSLKTFEDIQGHSAQEQIEALAARGIINGKSETAFEPDAEVTRAEFAALVTKSLGLLQPGSQVFADVTPENWFFNAVMTAQGYGIVNGVSATEFCPQRGITKEEAAVMVSRAATLCGVLNNTVADARDVLAAFTDYVTISQWAQKDMAFCYESKILSDDALLAEPQKKCTRAEIAVMLYQLLDLAKLL